MPDFLLVNGQARYTPGAPSEVDASKVSGPSAVARGVGALVYEADRGGEPYVARVVENAVDLASILPAREAALVGKFAFAPSTDPKVPDGFAKLVLVRANPATQASGELSNSAAVAATAKAADWGLYGNDLTVQVEAGTGSIGKKFTAQLLTDDAQVVDNAGVLSAYLAKYVAPAGTPPSGVVLTALTLSTMPNAANGAIATAIDFTLTVTGGTASFNPSSWMAFDGNSGEADGKLAFGFADQGSTKHIGITYVRKDTGVSVTESIEVLDNAVSAKTGYAPSNVTALDLSDLTGPVLVSGSAFSLMNKTAAGANAYNTIAKVADRINAFASRGFSCALQTVRTGLAVSVLDTTTTQSIVTTGYTATANLHDFIEKVNAGQSLVVLTRGAAATGLPTLPATATHLTGGGNGVASTGANGDWDKALQTLRGPYDVNTVCVLSSDSAVHALVKEHCKYMSGKGGFGCNSHLGVPSSTGRGTSAGQLYAIRSALAYRNVNLYCNPIDDLNENGEVETFEPYWAALAVAAIEAGRRQGTGITRKTVDVLDVHDYPGAAATNWTVQANKEELIANGYTLLEKTTKGIRVLRAVTTYGVDNNPIYCSTTANSYLNMSANGLQAKMDALVGEENTVPVAIIKSAVRDEMDAQISAGVIRAYDPKSISAIDKGNTVLVGVTVAVTEEYLWLPNKITVMRMPG